MKTNRFVTALLAGFLIGALVATAGQAMGHSNVAGEYYKNRWPAGNSFQTYGFTAGFPTGEFRDRVRDGLAPWNALNERVYFAEGAQVANFAAFTCPQITVNPNAVHWVPVGPNAAAASQQSCVNSQGEIVSSQVVFNASKTLGYWYTGASPSVTPGLQDAQSVAAHEWGHATGFFGPCDPVPTPNPSTTTTSLIFVGHFCREAGVCSTSGSSSDQTMCVTGQISSQSYWRTLEPHDVHTFKLAYPPTWFGTVGSPPGSGTPFTPFGFGEDGDVTLACDWDGNGTSTPGVRRSGAFHLRNSNSEGTALAPFAFGDPSDTPLCGDWNGDGTDTVGVYRPSTQTFYLNNLNASAAPAHTIVFGTPGDIPVVGNWNGSTGLNAETTGVYRPSTSQFFLNDHNTDAIQDYGFVYGSPGDRPVVGNWNGTTANKDDTIGVFRNGTWFLNDANDHTSPEYSFVYGAATDRPVVGNWDGSGSNRTDTVGVVRGG